MGKDAKEALETYYPGEFDVSFFDPLPSISTYLYGKLGSDWPGLWGLLYHSTNKTLLAKVINLLGSTSITNRILKYLEKVKPDVIIINHAATTFGVEKAVRKLGIKPKIVVEFADPFSVHKLWYAYKNANLYLALVEETISDAVKNGIPKDKLVKTGYPASSRFDASRYSKATTREILNLKQDSFVLYVGGSGQGGGSLLKLCKKLGENKTIKNRCQLVIVAGRNPSLVKKLVKLSAVDTTFFNVFAHANNVPQLLSASDLIVGKAGPSFIFEALFMGKPVFSTACLPGQEEGNLEFIQREDVGWVEKNLDKAVLQIERIVIDPKLIEEKLTNVTRVVKLHENSQKKFATEIAKLCGVESF